MLVGHWRDYRAGQRGQALLVAVLLMMVILLTGILFAAIVSYNQHQSARSSDVNAAQGLAEAGIRWCNENLLHSPQGADWRPPYRALDLSTFDQATPSTWPVPPVQDTSGKDYGTYGRDLAAAGTTDQTPAMDTADDYYSDFERARGWHGLVDAGTGEYIRYGFYRLPDVNGTPGAVTLPTEVGALSGKGHILVRVTYDPDPPYETRAGDPQTLDPMSGHIRIESIGVVDDEVPVFRQLVAYKPLALTDYTLFVTDRTSSGRTAKLGFNPRLDLDNAGPSADDWLAQAFYGPLRFNSVLELTGIGDATAGPSTQVVLTEQPTAAALEVPGFNPPAIGGGYFRDDHIEAASGISEPGWDYGTSPPTPLDSTSVWSRNAGGALTALGQVRPSNIPSGSSVQYSTHGGRVLDGTQSLDATGFSRYCPPVTAPDAFSNDGAERYRTLTRDSGAVVALAASGGVANLGRFGFGRGIYVDNSADLQFVDSNGVHDLDALMADWMRVFSQGEFTGENSGWNPTGTTYTAPGVEITLFPTVDAACDFVLPSLRVFSASPPNDTNPNTFWWPNHVTGEPGIRLTRSDRTWRWYNSATQTVQDSGEYTLYLDYPAYPNQLLFTEGNARVHGALPARDANAGNGSYRDYNLTIVSGGTIYIDGQIQSPQDVYGRDAGSGAPRTAATAVVPDEYNSKVALLARDCVCLNPTRVAPQLTSGSVAAMPDDPLNPSASEQHWVLSPEVQGGVYTTWTPGEAVPAGNTVNLSVIHTAADPGPAAITLSVYDTNMPSWTATWRAHTFNAADTVRGRRLFFFAQPGLLVPAPNVETTLAPNWTAPTTWNILPELYNTLPGVLKSAAISPADPGLANVGGGATDYWIKKWKVSEATADGTPTGTIHAKVNALIYAENGCWFVIPGDYFDPNQSGAGARAYRRYNYDICVRGAISEAFHAEPEMVRAWCDRWAWPVVGGGWRTIRYEFDETLRDTRDPRDLRPSTLSGAVRASVLSPATKLPGLTRATPQGNLPKLPLLPASKDLIFYGEGK